MNPQASQLSARARQAVSQQDWATVDACAAEILRQDRRSAEGYFLSGLVLKVTKQPAKALQAFETALALDADRYDAAVELANQYSVARRNGEAAMLLRQYEDKLGNSPMYLDLAGSVYSDIGMHQQAWSLYKKATELQPGVDLFQANLAACSVFLGKIDDAGEIYKALLRRFPNHRRNHYQLARLQKAKDDLHIRQMKQVLRDTSDTPDKNVFLYYGIAKELEDLERWDESFEFYKQAGDAVTNVAEYDVHDDIKLIDSIIEVCNADWLRDDAVAHTAPYTDKTPVFLVGLPRTGTTLTERIVSSHSQVQSVGETQFLQMLLRRHSGIQSIENMNPDMIRAVADKDMGAVGREYVDTVRYRLGPEPLFIDKLPFNFLFLGFIAKAWPGTRIIHMARNPMDACFSMYKQVFTWAYKFSYSLDDLGRYYVAYDRLRNHWRQVLGDTLIEVEYEALVTDQEKQTRMLLDCLGLEFEEACLEFEKNRAPSATASSVQVRSRIHSKSVQRWTRFETHLQPLREHLARAGIATD